jgi:arylformamidase
MKILDISMPLREGMTSWPGVTATRFPAALRISRGDPLNLTDIQCCAHTGTHVDSPFHHYADGTGMESLPLNSLVGRALVLDLSHCDPCVRASALRVLDDAEPFDILLTKTKNSTEKNIWDGAFDEDFIYIAPDAAEDLVRRGVKGLAVDALSVEAFDNLKGETHKILLRDGRVTIIEGVDLRKVEPGYYFLVCLPLKILGSDGAPARAVLLPDELSLMGRGRPAGA